ncbi:MAG: tail tape measure protein [Sphingomonadales bacterium]|nr:tail tape measure protein [Sphingomonadales bacterium]
MDEIDRMIVSVRADTRGFARDVAEMTAQLDGPLSAGADKAGRTIENALTRALRTGKLGFEDLKKIALSTLESIAASAIKSGLGSLFGGGGLVGLGASILGLPGRATGGPVSPGRAYVVGERGPEMFVPTSSGAISPNGAGATRDVRVSISVNAAGGAAPGVLERSSRQVARAVRAALEEE